MLLYYAHLHMHVCPQTYTHIYTVEKLKLGTSPATVSTKTENHSHCQILEAETRMKLPVTPPPHPPVSTLTPSLTPSLTPPSRQSEIRRSELESLTKAEVIRTLDFENLSMIIFLLITT